MQGGAATSFPNNTTPLHSTPQMAGRMGFADSQQQLMAMQQYQLLQQQQQQQQPAQQQPQQQQAGQVGTGVPGQFGGGGNGVQHPGSNMQQVAMSRGN